MKAEKVLTLDKVTIKKRIAIFLLKSELLNANSTVMYKEEEGVDIWKEALPEEWEELTNDKYRSFEIWKKK